MTDGKYVIPPAKKWMSLFSQCRQALGCHGDRDAEHKVVWTSISVALCDSRLSHNDQEIRQELLGINCDMEQTARVCGDLQTLQAYLSKVQCRVLKLSCNFKELCNWEMHIILLCYSSSNLRIRFPKPFISNRNPFPLDTVVQLFTIAFLKLPGLLLMTVFYTGGCERATTFESVLLSWKFCLSLTTPRGGAVV